MNDRSGRRGSVRQSANFVVDKTPSGALSVSKLAVVDSRRDVLPSQSALTGRFVI